MSMKRIALCTFAAAGLALAAAAATAAPVAGLGTAAPAKAFTPMPQLELVHKKHHGFRIYVGPRVKSCWREWTCWREFGVKYCGWVWRGYC